MPINSPAVEAIQTAAAAIADERLRLNTAYDSLRSAVQALDPSLTLNEFGVVVDGSRRWEVAETDKLRVPWPTPEPPAGAVETPAEPPADPDGGFDDGEGGQQTQHAPLAEPEADVEPPAAPETPPEPEPTPEPPAEKPARRNGNLPPWSERSQVVEYERFMHDVHTVTIDKSLLPQEIINALGVEETSAMKNRVGEALRLMEVRGTMERTGKRRRPEWMDRGRYSDEWTVKAEWIDRDGNPWDRSPANFTGSKGTPVPPR